MRKLIIVLFITFLFSCDQSKNIEIVDIVFTISESISHPLQTCTADIKLSFSDYYSDNKVVDQEIKDCRLPVSLAISVCKNEKRNIYPYLELEVSSKNPSDSGLINISSTICQDNSNSPISWLCDSGSKNVTISGIIE